MLRNTNSICVDSSNVIEISFTNQGVTGAETVFALEIRIKENTAMIDRMPFGAVEPLNEDYKLAGKVLILLWYQVLIEELTKLLSHIDFSKISEIVVTNETNEKNFNYMCYLFNSFETYVTDVTNKLEKIKNRNLVTFSMSLQAFFDIRVRNHIAAKLADYVTRPEFDIVNRTGLTPRQLVMKELGIPYD